VPVVLVNTEARDLDLPAIMSDNVMGGRVAAEHLIELGHRCFGYLMPPPRNVDAPARLRGVHAALRAAGLDPDGLVVAHGEALVGGGERAAAELLDRAPDTTAILAYNDLMAIGAVRALRDRGRRVPRDASVVGFDDVALAAYVDPPLTTIAQRTEEMGQWAVAQLTDETLSRPAGPIRLPVDLRRRQSSGRVPVATR
jgi:LacI family transcriptional regulator